MKLIGFLLSFLGALSLYCSHLNQGLLPQGLPAVFKGLGIVLLLIGLGALFLGLPKLVAVFSWVILVTFVWSFFPFVPLLKRRLIP